MVCILARRCVWTKGPVGGNIEHELEIWIPGISFLFTGPLLARSCNLLHSYSYIIQGCQAKFSTPSPNPAELSLRRLGIIP